MGRFAARLFIAYLNVGESSPGGVSCFRGARGGLSAPALHRRPRALKTRPSETFALTVSRGWYLRAQVGICAHSWVSARTAGYLRAYVGSSVDYGCRVIAGAYRAYPGGNTSLLARTRCPKRLLRA